MIEVIILGPVSAINKNNRGATELIARYLASYDRHKIQYVEGVNMLVICKWIFSGNSLMLIGMPYYRILQIILIRWLLILFSDGDVTVFRTATYSEKLRLTAERILGFVACLSNRIKILHLHNRVKNLYCKSATYNIIPALVYDLNKNNSNKINSRSSYNFGYVGRVCDEKGYYISAKILNELDALGMSCIADILLWSKEDIPIVNTTLNHTVSRVLNNKNSASRPPCYSSIDILILPYQSLNSTVQVPFVALEALISNCIVITSKEVVDVITPLLDIKKINGKLYEFNNENEILGLCKKCIKELNQQN